MKRYFTSGILLAAITLCSIGFKGYATAWTTGTAGAINTLSNWTNGTSSPTTFATPGDTWTITMTMTMTSSATWTVGTTATTPDTVTFATGGSLGISGAGGTSTITIYGNVLFTGGSYTLGGAGTTSVFNVYGLDSMSAGTFSTNGASSAATLNVHGNISLSGGTISTNGASGVIIMNVNGNFNMSSGVVNTVGSSCISTANIYGNFLMVGGTVNAGGAGGTTTTKVYGNCSISGPSAMTNTGAGSVNTLHLCLPTASGTMLADNTSTGAWSGTNAYIDAHCIAQLDGNFSTTMGGASYGLTVNGTLICPAAYMINGANLFDLAATGTLEVGIATGINGAIINTGTKTFSTSANYGFNGTTAQVTGTYLPASLLSPDTITINNSAGVTLSQTTATTGTLLFASGILNTGAFTMSVPGLAAAVTGAGATSYVNGTLIKTISGLTLVNYEVGDADYAPMLLTLGSAGTGGSLGIKATNGLHPSVASSGLSTANMANHYWTITNYSAAGPATVTPKATYNLADIIGGTNSSFQTQEYSGSAWLAFALATTNTSSPYTSVPASGIALGTLAGAYIFGNVFCGTSPITGGLSVCAGATTTLADATTGGTWASSTLTVATIGTGGMVTGVSAGTDEITYTKGGCAVTTTITVNPAPNPGIIKGKDTVCVGYTIALTDTTTGGAWTSGSATIAMIGSTGIVEGVAAGNATISYTVSNDCGTRSDTFHVKVLVATLGYCTRVGVSMVNPTTTELQLFPNPNTGQFTMNLSSEYDEAVQVAVTNIVGEKVKEFTSITNQETTITLNAAPGIYLLMATTEHGRFVAKVVIK